MWLVETLKRNEVKWNWEANGYDDDGGDDEQEKWTALVSFFLFFFFSLLLYKVFIISTSTMCTIMSIRYAQYWWRDTRKIIQKFLSMQEIYLYWCECVFLLEYNAKQKKKERTEAHHYNTEEKIHCIESSWTVRLALPTAFNGMTSCMKTFQLLIFNMSSLFLAIVVVAAVSAFHKHFCMIRSRILMNNCFTFAEEFELI